MITSTFIVVSIVILAAIVVAAVVFTIVVVIRAHGDSKAEEKEHGFLYDVVKDIVIPIVGPLLLTSLGFWVAFQLDRQRGLDTEQQGKDTILREMMTKGNGPDVAFFTAVGDRLTVHLQQYEMLCDAKAAGVGQGETTEEQTPEEKKEFEEKAIYFFYGMFRVAVIDFLATKGYVLYPRIWMERAFEGLTDDVVEQFMGTKERDDAYPREQAALYRYFGASKATYHTGSKRPDERIPDLFEFTEILKKKDKLPNETDDNKYSVREVSELRESFERFKLRLQHGQIDRKKIITTFEAMIGLDDYAFNTLFSSWYKQFKADPPVIVCPKPPDEFLPYPLRNFHANVAARESEEWTEERKRAWQLIFKKVPPSLRTDVNKEKTECAAP